MIPSPQRKVSRSSTVIGRLAGTVSSSPASIRRSTRRLASSGSSRSTGSSSLNLPSSTSIITAAAVIALVIEAMRKIVSRRMSAAVAERHLAEHEGLDVGSAGDEADHARREARFDVALQSGTKLF